MNDADLRSEIANDPAALGYAAHVEAGDHVGVASLLNDTSRGAPTPRPVPASEFAMFAAGMGLRSKLEAAGTSADPPAGLCKTLVELLAVSPHITAFDPANGLPLLGQLRDLGVISASDFNTVAAFVTRPASRAENLWGVGAGVDHPTVSRALRS